MVFDDERLIADRSCCFEVRSKIVIDTDTELESKEIGATEQSVSEFENLGVMYSLCTQLIKERSYGSSTQN